MGVLGTPKKIEYEGMSVEVDGDDKWTKDLYLGKYKSSSDRTDFKIYSDYVNEGDTVIDIGAFMGYHTLKLSREVAEKGVVYAFEPQKECFHQMKKMKNKLNMRSCKIYSLAVGNKSKKTLMKTRNEVDPTTNAVEANPWNHDYKQTEVEMVRLDRFCSIKNIENIDFVKIDVQGSGLKVIEGMGEMMSKTEKVYLEIHTKYMRRPKKEVKNIFRKLDRYGNTFEVKKNSLQKVSRPTDIVYEKYHPNILWFRR
jgi:FkbM family methyltransferase